MLARVPHLFLRATEDLSATFSYARHILALLQNMWDSQPMAKGNFSIRDSLARERTALANQRTLLAYGRTALGLVAAAFLIFRFGTPDVALVLGPLFLTAALFVMLWGLRSFKTTSVKLLGKAKAKRPASLKFRIFNRFGLAPRRHNQDTH